jgi:putative Holliday junction resolvase
MLTTYMKAIGIDYGSRRVGIALSDEHGMLAFPRDVLPNDPALIVSILALVKAEGVGAIVIGESLDRMAKDNPVMARARAFGEALSVSSGLPVSYIPEHYSTQEARRIQGDHAMRDASAAAIILQSWLDRNERLPERVEDEEETGAENS